MKYFMKIVNKLVLILSIFLSAFTYNNASALEKLPGEAIFLNHNNEPINFEHFEDQVLLVHFWATWCQNCFQEMKELDALQKEYRKQPFKIIALSIDFKGIEVVKKFYEQYHIKHLEIFLDQKNTLFKDFLINSIPTTLLIGKDLKVIETFNGITNWQDPVTKDLINTALKN